MEAAVKAYLITTGTVFAMIVAAHVARVFAEGARLVREPVFFGLTVLAAGLSFWAWWLLGRVLRSR
jgi:hypothetical protein